MKRKGWIVLASVLVGWLWCAPAWTCDDQGGKCKVEDWRWYSSSAGILMIEGSTTCDKGRIRFRLYEGTGDKRKFIGVDSGSIERAHLQSHDDEHPETEGSIHQVQHRTWELGIRP